jgi:hypothetical protein
VTQRRLTSKVTGFSFVEAAFSRLDLQRSEYPPAAGLFFYQNCRFPRYDGVTSFAFFFKLSFSPSLLSTSLFGPLHISGQCHFRCYH